MKSDIKIIKMQPEHIKYLAEIHYTSLQNDYLPSLGIHFLKSVYYPSINDSKHAITFIAVKDSMPIGFATIAHDSEEFIKTIMKKILIRFLFYGVITAIKKPSFLLSSFDLFSSVIKSKPDTVKGEIAFIAVKKDYQGQGIGKILVKEALVYLKDINVKYCKTKTLKKNNNVINMYESMGWKIRESFKLIGNEYVIIVSPSIF
ncbi:MAG: GNAT family N-acetyltransferase [Bacteroidota bacterium]